jgi:hypothetical protein
MEVMKIRMLRRRLLLLQAVRPPVRMPQIHHPGDFM